MCRALTISKDEEIQNTCLKIDENMKTDIDLPEMQMLTIIEGVCDLDGKLLFKNKELMDKFKAPTPKELARKLLLPGEITNLYRILQDVMGYGKNAVIEEVKTNRDGYQDYNNVLLLEEKGIRPSLFYAMDKGELKLIEAFSP